MSDKNPVSAWAAVAAEEIAKGTSLCRFDFGSREVQLLYSDTTLWGVLETSTKLRIGFRFAFAFGGSFSSVHLEKSGQDQVVISATCAAGSYRVTVTAESQNRDVLHYRTAFKPKSDLLLPFSPRDIVVLSANRESGEIYAAQEGTRSGNLFFGMKGKSKGSIFYFQDLGSLSAYCDQTETSAGGTVGGSLPELGFALPPAVKSPVSAAETYVISDAYVICCDEFLQQPADIAKCYLDFLAQIYLLLPKPDTEYHDWISISSQGLSDLKESKGCWTQAGGHSYINAYVCDYDTPPEVMVQLAVLVPLTEYFDWVGQPDPILGQLRDGLSAFYDEKLHALQRWLPSLKHRLDDSEEQKQDGVMDAWYLHHPLMNLGRLAIQGDKTAQKLFSDSLEFAIKVAKHFDYEWPVFYKMDTLEVVKAETEPGKGGEKDVPGAYAHLMLVARDFTGDERYLREAFKAVKRLDGLGFDIFYQANNTAFSAGALLRLYKETKDAHYLDLSYTCIACLFKNMQIWDGKYGNAKHYSRFMAIYPLSNAPYIAPYEELEVYAALTFYLEEAQGIDLLPSVRLLISEFVRYFVYRMPFYYPGNLPEDVISEDVKTGEIDRNICIPLEDLRDGWEKSGQVGQEAYGAAGAGFGIVARQYTKLGEAGIAVFCDYPIAKRRVYKNGSATFGVLGDARRSCKVRVLADKIADRHIKLFVGHEAVEATHAEGDSIEFSIGGNSDFKVEWK